MRRVALVLVAALFSATVSGMTDASPFQTGAQEREARRQVQIMNDARAIRTGQFVRIDRIGASRVEGILEEINADSLDVLIVKGASPGRTLITAAGIKKITLMSGRQARKSVGPGGKAVLAAGGIALVGLLVAGCAGLAHNAGGGG